jgi:hypothetical protein
MNTTQHLRDLMEMVTPGRWMDDPECAPCRVFSDWIPPGRTAAIAPVVCETLPFCGDRRKQGPANAALIAAMRNALPKLLAVVESAEALSATLVDAGFRDGQYYDLDEAVKLKAALKELGQ